MSGFGPGLPSFRPPQVPSVPGASASGTPPRGSVPFGDDLFDGGMPAQPIASSAPPSPFAVSPSFGQPPAAPANPWDMTQPGTGEQAYADNKDFWFGPTNSGDYWESVSGEFAPGSAGQTTLPSDAGLGEYYDRAGDRTRGAINDELSSRGLFNSSAGLQQLSDASVALGAEEANRRADYMLAVDAARQGWEGLELGRYELGGGLSGNADRTNLAFRNSGFEAATSAQNQRRDRVQDYFSNTVAPAAILAGIAGGAYGDLFTADDQYVDGALGFETGRAAEDRNQTYRSQENIQEGINTAVSFFSPGMSPGSRGGRASGVTQPPAISSTPPAGTYRLNGGYQGPY